MILTVLRRVGQRIYRTSVYRGLSDVFLMTGLGLWVFGRAQRGRALLITSRPGVQGPCRLMTYTVDTDLGHLAQVCLSVSPLRVILCPLCHTVLCGRKSLCEAHT